MSRAPIRQLTWMAIRPSVCVSGSRRPRVFSVHYSELTALPNAIRLVSSVDVGFRPPREVIVCAS